MPKSRGLPNIVDSRNAAATSGISRSTDGSTRSTRRSILSLAGRIIPTRRTQRRIHINIHCRFRIGRYSVRSLTGARGIPFPRKCPGEPGDLFGQKTGNITRFLTCSLFRGQGTHIHADRLAYENPIKGILYCNTNRLHQFKAILHSFNGILHQFSGILHQFSGILH